MGHSLCVVSSHGFTLSDAGAVASIVTALGIVSAVAAWLRRQAPRHVFPELSIEISGVGFHVVEHETKVTGASSSIVEKVELWRFQLTIVSREPDRNSALTFTLRFKGKDPDAWPEVIWATPQWRVDPEDLDEHLDLLVSPINLEREHAVAGVLLFQQGLPPVDVSIAPELDVFDHVSRARVRMPAQMGTYDRRSWVTGAPKGRIRGWWYRVLQREERYRVGPGAG